MITLMYFKVNCFEKISFYIRMIGNPLFRNCRITIPEHFGTANKKRTPKVLL